MHEVLFPNVKRLEAVFENEFDGMTGAPVELGALEAVRCRLLHELPRALLSRQREFQLSMARATPGWALMPFPHLKLLPALQWKLVNLERLRKNGNRFAQQHDELNQRLASLG